MPVSAAAAVTQTVPVEIRVFGNVVANQTAAIKSQIGGFLTDIHFKEGRTVHQGDPLFSIDVRPYETALQVAEANLARDTAQYENARKEEAREKELLGKGVASQGDYDVAQAAAGALAAAIAADKAAIERAKLDIGYCKIDAPFDGRAGACMVDKGNLVKANDIPLVTINQIRPIQVSFAVRQDDLGEIQKQMQLQHEETRRPGADPRPGRPARGRRTDVRRQHRQHLHRHRAAEGHLCQCPGAPLARPVRQRGPGALSTRRTPWSCRRAPSSPA